MSEPDLHRVAGSSPCVSVSLTVALSILSGCAADRIPLVPEQLFTEEATRDATATLDLREGETLTVEIGRGSIEVRAARETTSQVDATLSVHARTAEEARSLLEHFHLEAERTDAGTSLRIRGQPVKLVIEGGMYEITPAADLRIIVPPSVVLRATAGSAGMDVHGPLGPCDLATSFGDVRLSDVAGDVRVRSKSGSIELRDARDGTTDLRTGFGALSIAGVRGSEIRAESKSGNVTATSLEAESVVLRSGFGTM